MLREPNNEEEFIWQSNLIEKEDSAEAFDDALKAWEYAKTLNTIGLGDVTRIHRILMRNLNPEIAGRWGDCDIIIGDHYRKFTSKADIENRVSEVLAKMNTPVESDKEEYCKETHVHFEKVHPHTDGNGRVGRILWQWHRMKLGLPIEIIYDKDKQSYYQWFK